MKKTLPPYTISAMVVSAIGAFLALFGQFLQGSQDFEIGLEDLLGIGLAFFATVMLGLYFVFLQMIENNISKEGIYFFQSTCIVVVYTPISVPVDDWSFWPDLQLIDYIVFASFLSFGYVIPNLIQIQCIRVVGAPLVSTLLPLRLVVALGLGASPLLNEAIGWVNVIGATIVTLTVAIYLTLQYRTKIKLNDMSKMDEGKEQPIKAEGL